MMSSEKYQRVGFIAARFFLALLLLVQVAKIYFAVDYAARLGALGIALSFALAALNVRKNWDLGAAFCLSFGSIASLLQALVPEFASDFGVVAGIGAFAVTILTFIREKV